MGGFFVKTTLIDLVMMLFTGYVVKVLWGWFFVPTFNARPINIGMGIGLSIMCEVVTRRYIPASGDAVMDWGMKIGDRFVTLVSALVVGGLVYASMPH